MTVAAILARARRRSRAAARAAHRPRADFDGAGDRHRRSRRNPGGATTARGQCASSSFANVAQTIPSLALLGFLLPLPIIGGVGPRTALVALSLYALLPIVRGTVLGLRGVDAAVLEAGVAMGMTSRQLLTMVELPLALPSIVAGIRVSTVIGVGTATIAAAIGAGGLGEFIFRGLAMVDTTTILAGAVPAARPRPCVGWHARVAGAARRRRRGLTAVALPLALGLLAVVIGVASGVDVGAGRSPIVVGSKNFTEQVVLGELVAQAHRGGGRARCSQAQSWRHVRLRSWSAHRRYRRLCRVHRDGRVSGVS